ncbi:MAG TPA: helix-turn-helix transcriptional regulator [Solirubrobacterales bacterium]|jgi:transcriptional regulator with XRE-family HTH domain|nr:helix-turn-helix transcriptional regulator [Solirubrobacterales bacterium]
MSAAGKPKWTAGEPTVLVRDFATNLRAIREEKGLSREDLAEEAGIGIEHLIELEEAGGTIPSIGVVLRLAGTLGCQPSGLVAGVVWVPFEIHSNDGRFEVIEDAELKAEIAALKASLAKRRGLVP